MSFTSAENEGSISTAEAEAPPDETASITTALEEDVVSEIVETPPSPTSAFSQAFSKYDLSTIPAEIKPEARLPYTLTLDNSLLLKVNRHIAGFDGTICSNPVRVMCGAQEHFRANYCDKGEPRCYDLGLFSKGGYKVWKPADDEYS
jgi:hypothetical protein